MKFRVWDRQGRRFYNGKVLVSQNGQIFAFDSLTDVSDRFEIDRWTGLCDTHGKEIYENDIVVWGHHCPECWEKPVRIAVVKMDPDIQFHELRMGTVFEYCLMCRDASHLEVVGNVRENPEALEDPDAFLDKVFRPLDRFMIFPRSEKGKAGGFLLYEGQNFVAYGYGNGKAASPFYDKAIPINMGTFKTLLSEFSLIDTSLVYTTTEGEVVALWEVEDVEDLPDEGALTEVLMTIGDMGALEYRTPYFRFSSFLGYVEKGARRYGLARFFLRVLDIAWRQVTKGV